MALNPTPGTPHLEGIDGIRRELLGIRRALERAEVELEAISHRHRPGAAASPLACEFSLMSVRRAVVTEKAPGAIIAFAREFRHPRRPYRREASVTDVAKVLAVLGGLVNTGTTDDYRLRLTVARGPNGADIGFEPTELIRGRSRERLSRPQRVLAALGLPQLGTSTAAGAVEVIRGLLLLPAFGPEGSLFDRPSGGQLRGTTTSIRRLTAIAKGFGIDHSCSRSIETKFVEGALAALGGFLATPRALEHSAGGLLPDRGEVRS